MNQSSTHSDPISLPKSFSQTNLRWRVMVCMVYMWCIWCSDCVVSSRVSRNHEMTGKRNFFGGAPPRRHFCVDEGGDSQIAPNETNCTNLLKIYQIIRMGHHFIESISPSCELMSTTWIIGISCWYFSGKPCRRQRGWFHGVATGDTVSAL